MPVILKTISRNQINDFISYAKTGKKDKLQKAIDMGINILVDDAKAFILSARYGQLDTLTILLNNITSIEKTNILRHCFLESCNNNQRHIIDYLMENYLTELNDERMEEMALKTCIIGQQNDVLLYLCAKYDFNIHLNKDILNWALKNDYKDSYTKLEIVLLNKTFKHRKPPLLKKAETNKI